MRLIELFWKNNRGTIAADIAKAGAAIAFLSVIAANFLSSQTASLDKDRLAQVSLAASKRDPMTTGSIARAAGDTKLDPCALPR
ncbi:hypothetical protein ASE61_09580 [Bosea sp. Root670]|jgi:hypothetical protein|uniref:Flp pilus-assembly TadG-like N-terminal domain-containing protein n=1 Tax=Bosea robiniae TaxID=1036780 RepID=A0ABY0P4E1_9HYPH|nr:MULTISPECIES: hypothetical protein [Bosea]KRE03864.1 hypothetical protein ASE61_09580 [Bosea sp. Root670]TQI77150.1 hypothetical protein FHT98_4957 [Bosea sp. AK1]SDH04549.1 hypothetical protein SAMN05421844_106324 [Bosea robiniae]